MKRLLHAALVLVTVLALAAPAAAYVVILEDGSRLMAEKEYRVEDGKAIIELPNGTVTFIRADRIDVEATKKANEQGYGQALVIEDGESRKRPADERREEKQESKSLVDLARSRRDDSRRLEPHRRQEPETSSAPLPKTPAGFVDLQNAPRRPYRNVEVAAEIQRFFRGQGIDHVELYQGSEPTRPFAEITTNSEASVFRALEIAAEALLATREDHADRVAAFEVLLATPERERAGQFLLTPDLARELVGEEVEVAEFFVEHVQF